MCNSACSSAEQSPSPTTSARSASGPRSARWSARRTWPSGRTRDPRNPPGRRGRPRQCRDARAELHRRGTASLPRAATRTSTTSSSSQRPTVPQAPRVCSTRIQSDSPTARHCGAATRSSASSTPPARGRGVGARPHRLLPLSAPYEDLKLRSRRPPRPSGSGSLGVVDLSVFEDQLYRSARTGSSWARPPGDVGSRAARPWSGHPLPSDPPAARPPSSVPSRGGTGSRPTDGRGADGVGIPTSRGHPAPSDAV